MDKLQKFDYMQSIEQYLEDHQVYELFEDLLKRVVVARPEDPLDFIMKQLMSNKVRRVFFMGPPGSCRHENSLALSEYFHWKLISVKDLLQKEVSKKTDIGKRITECNQAFQYVDDQIIIDLVKKEVEALEAQQQSWIIQGFPRTKVQALALQQMGIVPDKFIHVNVRQQVSCAKIKQNLININQSLYGPELDDLANQVYQEYLLHQEGVNSVFNQFIYQYEVGEKQMNEVASDIARVLRIRFRNNAPRRPPRVILLGPPGSGRSTQASTMAERFGLVKICCRSLLKKEMQRNPQITGVIQDALDKGEMVPDEIVLTLVEKRLRQSDCRVNGWVMDGFPQTEAQVKLLQSMRIKPSLVCIFEQAFEESSRRLSNRRLDPVTGIHYNLEINPPKDDSTAARLIEMAEDSEEIVKKRYERWSSQVSHLEETFKNMLLNVQSDKPVDGVTEQIADAIQNPIF